MAAPGTPVAGAYFSPGFGTSAAIAVPAGVANLDVVLVSLHKENSNAVTAPADFTLYGGAPVALTSPGYWHYLYWKRATGADSGTYSFSWSGSDWRTGIACRVPGCITTGDPIDAHNSAVSATQSTTMPAVSLDTTGPDRLIIWLADLWDTAAFTAPTGYTRPTNSWTTNRLLDLCYVTQAAAGSTGSVTGTIGTARERISRLLALKPPAAADTTSLFPFFVDA